MLFVTLPVRDLSLTGAAERPGPEAWFAKSSPTARREAGATHLPACLPPGRGPRPCRGKGTEHGRGAARPTSARPNRAVAGRWAGAATLPPKVRYALHAAFEQPRQLNTAPLAQSAERLHGKEKVYGSIP
jgi:hypothetical protein